jgi:hypothetical protein
MPSTHVGNFVFNTYLNLNVEAAFCVFKDVGYFNAFIREYKWPLMRVSFSVRSHCFHAFATMDMAVGPVAGVWNIPYVFWSTLIEKLIFSKGCFYHWKILKILTVENRLLGVQRTSVEIAQKV